MSHENIWKDVEHTLRTSCSYQGKIWPEATLAGDLGLDSMALLTLTVEIENKYKIILGDGRSVPETLGQVVVLIEQALLHAQSTKH